MVVGILSVDGLVDYFMCFVDYRFVGDDLGFDFDESFLWMFERIGRVNVVFFYILGGWMFSRSFEIVWFLV